MSSITFKYLLLNYQEQNLCVYLQYDDILNFRTDIVIHCIHSEQRTGERKKNLKFKHVFYCLLYDLEDTL